MSMKKLLVVGAALTFAACGGDDEASNNTSNNNNNSTNNSNNTNTTNNENNSNNNNSNNSNNNNSNNSNNNNSNNSNNNTIPPFMIEELPGCDDPNPPARCSTEPSGYTWGPASVLTSLVIASAEDDCCFDYNDDGNPDNGLGGLLGSANQLNGVNMSISDTIADGSLAAVLEYDGLDDLANDDDFTVNFFIGSHDGTFTAIEPAGSNPVLIDPASIDMGTQSLAYLPGATNTDGSIITERGTVSLELELTGVALNLRISEAIIAGDIDSTNSALDATGIALQNGRLGGFILNNDVFGAVNAIAASCECLKLDEGQSLVNPANGTCADVSESTCAADGETTCDSIASNCTLLSLVGLAADIDLNDDGVFDAVSLAATLTAAGATINGIE